MKRTISLALAVLALAMPAMANHLTVPKGYGESEVSFSSKITGFDIAPNGNYIVIMGNKVKEMTPEGTTVQELYKFSDEDYPNGVWGSFVQVDAATNKAYFGESSNGWVRSIDLDDLSVQNVALVDGNYDFVMDNNGGAYVNTWSDISYLNLSTGSLDTVVTSASPWQGPMTLDADGNLYYGTSGYFEDGAEWLVKWDKNQLDSAKGEGSLDFGSGEKIAKGLPMASGMLFDGSDLFFTTNVWGGSHSLMVNSSNGLGEFGTSDLWISVLRRNPVTGAISAVLTTSTNSIVATFDKQVPEPGSLIALVMGLGGVVAFRKRK